MTLFFLIIDALMTFVPFIVTGIYYPSMPDKIPLFVNLMGEPIMMADKTVFTAFRLPVIALILQGICIAMYLGCRKNTADKPKMAALFRNFWLAASLIAAVKLSSSSLPYTGVVPYYLIPMFRIMTVASASIGVVYMLVCLARMFKEAKENYARIFIPENKVYAVIIAILLAAYVAAAFLPKIL